MDINAQYIEHKGQWSAFTTLNGLDIQEYGDTEDEARKALIERIAASEFLLEGVEIEKL